MKTRLNFLKMIPKGRFFNDFNELSLKSNYRDKEWNEDTEEREKIRCEGTEGTFGPGT